MRNKCKKTIAFTFKTMYNCQVKILGGHSWAEFVVCAENRE